MYKALWLIIFFGVLVWSAIEPHDTVIWLLEAGPAIIGFIILAATYQTFRLTPLTYFLILIHCVILMVGAHYTYAEVPLFDQIQQWMGSDRNNYDKLGHFAQGFVPAIITREIVIRKHVFNNNAWQAFFIVCFCLAFSAFYELIEWWVAIISDETADAFLGTQGYIWDTQSDMGYALLGAISSLILLGHKHNQQLQKLQQR